MVWYKSHWIYVGYSWPIFLSEETGCFSTTAHVGTVKLPNPSIILVFWHCNSRLSFYEIPHPISHRLEKISWDTCLWWLFCAVIYPIYIVSLALLLIGILLASWDSLPLDRNGIFEEWKTFPPGHSPASIFWVVVLCPPFSYGFLRNLSLNWWWSLTGLFPWPKKYGLDGWHWHFLSVGQWNHSRCRVTDWSG